MRFLDNNPKGSWLHVRIIHHPYLTTVSVNVSLCHHHNTNTITLGMALLTHDTAVVIQVFIKHLKKYSHLRSINYRPSKLRGSRDIL